MAQDFSETADISSQAGRKMERSGLRHGEGSAMGSHKRRGVLEVRSPPVEETPLTGSP